MSKKQQKTAFRIAVTALLLIVFHFVPFDSILSGRLTLLFYLVPYCIIGHDILKKAWKGICNRQPFDECFLMAVATIGAIILGDYKEGVAVMLFYQIGELFQSYAVGKSRKSIGDLMDIRPDYAYIELEDGTIEKVDPDEVVVGSITVVKPGEKIPIDGIVTDGTSTLNTAALTGESVPVDVSVNDSVISGCINLTGFIRIKTTKEFGESTASKILDMVENASSKKSRSEAFITRFARIYTPAVCYGALALAIFPPVVLLMAGQAPMWLEWINRALTFLVISCPCALVISIPLTFFAGIGGASNAGVLVKGSNYLEMLAKAETVVFDKTGTMTKGVFQVVEINHASMPEEDLIEYAALAEYHSNHPISISLKKACTKALDAERITSVEEISGHGVKAVIDGKAVLCGNDKLMHKENIPFLPCSSIGTVVHVAINGEYAGQIVISDELKPTAKSAVDALKKLGIEKTVMLTGDRAAAANQVAKELNVSECCSELLPGDKVSKVEALLQSKAEGKTLVFVGDGINDAPVLARADVGIAMGALGSDAAIEAADIVLMDDDPLKIAKAIRIARKCMAIVQQNIVFAIAVKFICLILGALGIASMWLAIFADVGVMVIAVLNAIRALHVKK